MVMAVFLRAPCLFVPGFCSRTRAHVHAHGNISTFPLWGYFFLFLPCPLRLPAGASFADIRILHPTSCGGAM